MRFLTILLVIVASCFASYKYSPHHHADSPFKTLYMHLMPVPLLVDNHAPHGEEDALLTVPLPESLGALDWAGRFAGDHGHGDHAADVHGPELAVYNLQIFQIAAILIILIAFSGVPAYLRTGKGDKVTKTMAGFCMWLKEDVVHPVMGDHFTHKFLPYFMGVFFFILFMNLLGLTPASATATASIYVTAALALTTFLAMVICGSVVQGPIAFWKNLVPHVPGLLWPLMFVVELIGLLVKPFALMIRLFANMSGGHMVVLSFMGLLFFFAEKFGPSLGAASAPLAVGFAVFIMIIEGFVAMVQAYIFTQLSVIFVNAAVHPEH